MRDNVSNYVTSPYVHMPSMILHGIQRLSAQCII